MTRLIAILLIILLFYYVAWPFISKWLTRKALEKTEDYLRASMGMPPREKNRNTKKNHGGYQSDEPPYGARHRRPSYSSGPIIPKEYAEDVEFTEMINYSSTTEERHSAAETEIYHESQISDAEWVEIKKSGS